MALASSTSPVLAREGVGLPTYSRLDSSRLNSLLCSVLAEKRNVARLNTWGKVTDCSTTYCAVLEDAELESIVKREG